MNKNKPLNYSILLSNGDNLQRTFYWQHIQQKAYLNALMNTRIDKVNLGVITLIENPNEFIVIDGQHRIKTIQSFLNGHLQLDNKYYVSYNTFFDRALDMRAVATIWYDVFDDIPKLAIFEMCNFMGTAQDLQRFEEIKNKFSL